MENKKYVNEIQRQILLIKDFEEEYGEILLQTDKATYNGGPKNHIVSGIFGKHQSGSLYLSDRYLIFVKEDKRDKRIRVEHQKYPNKEAADTFVKKMFS